MVATLGAIKDLGPLTWNVPIVLPTGRPTPEFQRKWETQRSNNTLIGAITFGNGPPTSVPLDGAEYVDTSTTPYTLYIGKDNTWHQTAAIRFTDLLDAPHDYTGAGSRIVRVNSGATGLEFDTVSATLDDLGSSRGDLLFRNATVWTVLAPSTAGELLQTGGTGGNPSWSTLSAILDGISSTEGSILYRGATTWAALGPGTSGYFLQTQGPSADPVWAAGGGGGGGPAYAPAVTGDLPGPAIVATPEGAVLMVAL